MLGPCRICLSVIHSPNCVNVYLKTSDDALSIIELMRECASIEVASEDDLPKFICSSCSQKLKFVYEFCNLIISSDEYLKAQIQCKKESNPKSEIVENIPNDPLQSKIIEVLIKEESTESLIDENCEENNSIETLVPPPKSELQIPTSENSCSNTEGVRKVKKRSFKCQECGKVLRTWYGLKKHQVEHTGVKPFVCEYCNKSFPAKMCLVVHTRIHTNNEPFPCSICKKEYRSLSGLRLHEIKHKGVKMFNCDICNKGFFDSYGLQNHVRTHTGEKPFMCEICGKTFSNYGSFLGHKRIHQARELPCSICGKAFKNKRSLRHHVRRHSGVKAYCCEDCGKKYTESSSLTLHRNTVHFGIKNHKCTVCEKSFSQSSNLVIHMLTHSGKKPFSCSFCPKEFAYKQHLRSHMKKQHEGVEEVTHNKSD